MRVTAPIGDQVRDRVGEVGVQVREVGVRDRGVGDGVSEVGIR